MKSQQQQLWAITHPVLIICSEKTFASGAPFSLRCVRFIPKHTMRYFPRQVKSTVSCTNRFDFVWLGTVASACFTSVAVSKFVFAASEKSITSCLSIEKDKKPTRNTNPPLLQVNDYKRCNGVTDNYCPPLLPRSVKSRMSFKICLPIQNFCNFISLLFEKHFFIFFNFHGWHWQEMINFQEIVLLNEQAYAESSGKVKQDSLV